MSKPWDREKAPKKQRVIKNTFLVYCEGENTEPEYFKSFPVTTETRVQAMGYGRSKYALVNLMIEDLGKLGLLKGGKDYDEDRQLWCVFDRDIKPSVAAKSDEKNYNDAISTAYANGIKVAFSNDSFELWLLLHYSYLDTQITRAEYYKKLSGLLKINYEKEAKTKKYSKTLYDTLILKQTTAIKHAKKLHDSHKDKIQHHEYCPCTTVYLLVEELNKCLR